MNTLDKPTLLNECVPVVKVDDKYFIQVEPASHMTIIAGFSHDKAGAKYEHPNISASVKKIHEYKHYRKGGSKFWTRKAGIDKYLVIPYDKIALIPYKGYSYVKAEINGVPVTFNVSGGGAETWSDSIGKKCHIFTNMKISAFKKIVEVAIKTDMEIPRDEYFDEKVWDTLAFNTKADVKEEIARMIEQEKAPNIILQDGYSLKQGIGIEVIRRRKVERIDATHRLYAYNGALKGVIINIGSCRYKVKNKQIDWHKTAKENINKYFYSSRKKQIKDLTCTE